MAAVFFCRCLNGSWNCVRTIAPLYGVEMLSASRRKAGQRVAPPILNARRVVPRSEASIVIAKVPEAGAARESPRAPRGPGRGRGGCAGAAPLRPQLSQGVAKAAQSDPFDDGARQRAGAGHAGVRLLIPTSHPARAAARAGRWR